MVSYFFFSFFLVISFVKQSHFTEAFLTISGFYILGTNEHLFIKVMIKIHAFHILKFYSEININISGVVYRKREYILPFLPLFLFRSLSFSPTTVPLSLSFLPSSLFFSFFLILHAPILFFLLFPSLSPLPHLVYVLPFNLMTSLS